MIGKVLFSNSKCPLFRVSATPQTEKAGFANRKNKAVNKKGGRKGECGCKLKGPFSPHVQTPPKNLICYIRPIKASYLHKGVIDIGKPPLGTMVLYTLVVQRMSRKKSKVEKIVLK